MPAWRLLLLTLAAVIVASGLHALMGFLVFARDRDLAQTVNETAWFAVKSFVIFVAASLWMRHSSRRSRRSESL